MIDNFFMSIYLALNLSVICFLLPYLNKIWHFCQMPSWFFVALLNYWVINQNPGKKIKHFCCIVAKNTLIFNLNRRSITACHCIFWNFLIWESKFLIQNNLPINYTIMTSNKKNLNCKYCSIFVSKGILFLKTV